MSDNSANKKELKIDVASDDFDPEKKPDLSNQQIDVWQLVLTTMLLCGPFLMGMIICQLTNAVELKKIYSVNASFPIAADTMEKIWSLGGFFPIGGMFGALISANLVDSLGRKKSTIAFCVVMLIGNIFGLVSMYVSFGLLVVARFLSGAASAALMVTALCWMFERLPTRLENIYKPLAQLIINCGIIASSVFNLDEIMASMNFGMFLIPIILSVVAIVFAMITDESPKWRMLQNHDMSSVEADMKRLRGDGFSREEFDYIKGCVAREQKQSKMTLGDFITSKRLRPAVISAIFLHVAQQLSGINAIVSFAQDILGKIQNVNLYVTGILSLNALFSLIFCLIVAKFPRRTMLLFGHGLMAIGYVIFIVTKYATAAPPNWLLIFSLCVVLFAFQAAPGPMVWFITFEMFPSNAVGVAQGLSSSTNWIANSVIFFVFPLLTASNISQENCLMIFLVINIIVCIYIWIFIVETKNRKVDDILDEYRQRYHM